MNIAEVGIICAICTPLITGTGMVAKFYGDNTYVLISETLEAKLYDYRERIFLLEQKDIITEDEENHLLYLKLRAQELETKIN